MLLHGENAGRQLSVIVFSSDRRSRGTRAEQGKDNVMATSLRDTKMRDPWEDKSSSPGNAGETGTQAGKYAAGARARLEFADPGVECSALPPPSRGAPCRKPWPLLTKEAARAVLSCDRTSSGLAQHS